MICTIVCGAPCGKFPGEFPKELVEGYVIAADRGLDYCLAAGITPDLAVGDFDSAAREIPDGIECVRVSPIKDDTDAELAAELAVERGFHKLRFLCALGGRLDHSIANIQMAYRLKRGGVSAELYGGGVKAFFAENEHVSIPRRGGYLSLFAYGGEVEVSESGVKYPLSHAVLSNDFPLGVSNEIVGEFAEIEVFSGTLLILLVDEDNVE